MEGGERFEQVLMRAKRAFLPEEGAAEESGREKKILRGIRSRKGTAPKVDR